MNWDAQFVNLTPHTIVLPTGPVEPSGILARCEEETVPVGTVGGVPAVVRRYGKVVGLPESHGGIVYIVSHITRTACPGRLDLVSPGDLVRDAEGQIIGCSNLVMNSLAHLPHVDE